jgi:hypothetical protein
VVDDGRAISANCQSTEENEMIRIRQALVAVALLPAVALAQRGRDRGTKADYGAMEREAPAPMKLKVGDLEDVSPLKLLFDKRKDLKLTDDQQAQLKVMQGKLKETNDVLMKRLDSLRIALRPSPNPNEEDRLRLAIGREELGTVVKAIRVNYDASTAPAMALLDEGQKSAAQGLLEKLAKETDEMLRDKMGGRAGGPPGGRPGRPPN